MLGALLYFTVAKKLAEVRGYRDWRIILTSLLGLQAPKNLVIQSGIPLGR